MNNKKRIVISSIVTLIILMLAYAGFKVIGQSTNEMLSEGDGLPTGFPYITYEDLINERDILCCGKGIPLIDSSKTIVRSGGKSSSEPYLKMNDIGKQLFKVTVDAAGGSSNPYSSATSYTYGYYKETERKSSDPMESYILAEISENLPSQNSSFYNVTNREFKGDKNQAYFYNMFGTVIYGVNIDEESGEPQDFVVQDEQSGKYYYIEITDNENFFPYTYVQYAWWKTPAGGSAGIQSTALYKEAEAFEAYINKVAKKDSSGSIVTEQKTATVNGKTATVTAPVIDYKITGEDENAEAQYDEDNRRYLIGPFKLNYYEESVTTERGKVDFSSIVNATLVSNLGEVDKTQWFFKYNERAADDTAEYPHNGEEFYIVLDYIEGMRYIEDLKFDFKYMNAGGEYSELKGEFFNANWEPESEAIWCDEGPRNCSCGGHHTSAKYNSEGKRICSGGARRCSHGYYNNHIAKWNYWLELKGLTPKTSQPLAQVYVGVRWYEDASYSFNIDLPQKEYIKLTIPMEGQVWIDKVPDKKNPQYVEGTKQDGEEGYKNAEVYIYRVFRDNSGNVTSRELADIYEEDNETQISYPIYTDENGKYKVPNINVPGSEETGFDVSFDVEFKYDGQHYEASNALPTANGDINKYINASKEEKKLYENDSLASENAVERDIYNNKFKEVYGGNAMQENGDTRGYSTNGKDTLNLDYTSTEFSLPNNENTRRQSTLTVLDENEHIIEQYKMRATTGNTGLYFPVDNKISIESADDVVELSVIEDEQGKTTTYKTIYDYMMHINLAVKRREEADLSVFKDLYKAEILVNEKEITKTYNKYIDVEKEENKDALEIQIEACRIGKYTIGLYSSDYEYRSTVYENSADVVKNIKAGTDMKVYLTYRIAVNNETQAINGLEATINQLDDYYDSSFTLVNSDISANVLNNNQDRVNKVVAESPYYRIVKPDAEDSSDNPLYTYWSDGMKRFTCNDTNTNVNDDYKKLTITDLKDEKIAIGQQLEMFITFEVDRDGFKNAERAELLGEKNNVAEIANYSTYYPNGKVAGIVDRDSAPGNIDLNRNVKEWYEDDTESAPAANITLYRYNREINGNVWEDSETVDLLYGQKVGNGLMEDGEKKVPNIDVQLVEKIFVDGVEYEKIWSEDDFKDLTPEELKEFRLKDVETDENGNYYFKGVLAGNYVVRFKYGNKEANIKYNGQDYKNTAYQAGMTNEDGTQTLNNEWQDIRSGALNEARISDARDYELQRMKVIAYSKNIGNHVGTVLESADSDKANHTELIKNTQMVANTAKLNIEIEHQDYIDYGTVKTVDGLEEFTYYVKNIDFGLERRSGTVIELDKKISRVSLYKDDGDSLLLDVTYNEDGTIDKEKSDSQYLNKLSHVDEQGFTQGLEYVHAESDFLNGARLKIEYKITVKNKSEVDWTGKVAKFETDTELLSEVEKLEKTEPYVTGKMIEYGEYVGLNYYNNANNYTDRIVETKVEKIIDYIDNDVSADEDDNTGIEDGSWRAATLEELQNGKMLDEKVYTEINGKSVLADSKQRLYIEDNKSNVLISEDDMYNPSAICKLVPESAAESINGKSSGTIRIVTAKNLSQDSSKDDLYNNIAEVLEYSNTVGRRDEMAVPGNAQVAKGEYAAATGYKDGQLMTDYEGAKEVAIGDQMLHLNGERDTDAPNFVTITEPTGISIREYNEKTYYTVAIVVAGIILAAGIVVIKKKIIK